MLTGARVRKLVLVNADEVRALIEACGLRSPAQRLNHKLHCALLVAEGRSCYEVARWFGESPRTIERWVLAFGQSGSPGLETRSCAGRPARLNASALEGLLRDLATSPAVFGYSAQVWSPKLLMLHLGRGYKINLGLRQCQRAWRRLQMARLP